MALMSLSKDHQELLLEIARNSIQQGLLTGKALPIDLIEYPENIQERMASFVTLSLHQELRGCIGVLEAIRPLAIDVAENAFAAAFRDSRFPVVTIQEFKDLEIHLSLLTPAEPVVFNSEEELISLLNPGIDGLILEEGRRRGTFLPSVWEALPRPEEFLQHLKQKAGLSADYWSDEIRMFRYRTEVIR
jgi:uncharacterized protein